MQKELKLVLREYFDFINAVDEKSQRRQKLKEVDPDMHDIHLIDYQTSTDFIVSY